MFSEHIFKTRQELFSARKNLFQTAKKLLMRSSRTIPGTLFRVQKMPHSFGTIVPKKRGVVKKTIPFEVLRIAAALFLSKDIIILAQLKWILCKDLFI